MSDHLENELREALARVQPLEGFVDRVVANIPERRRRKPPYWLMAAAAALTLVFLARFEQEQHDAQKRATEIQQQVTFAFRLTAEKLTVIDGNLKRSAPQVQIDRAKGEL